MVADICGSSGMQTLRSTELSRYIHRYVPEDLRSGIDVHTCGDVVCLHMGIITLA